MYVYLLQSQNNPHRTYVGLTANLETRLVQRNAGKSIYTSKYRPWRVKVAIWFDDSEKARAFETYLKKGSGHAFARRHFW